MHIILDRKKEEGNMNFYMATKTSNKRIKSVLEALVRNNVCEILEKNWEQMILINEVRIRKNDDI